MIEITRGDLFAADVAALVNPVNGVGVMKRGLSRQFKTRFPENHEQYQAACTPDPLAPGTVLVHDRGGLFGDADRPRYVLNVVTKQHWSDLSGRDHIEAGVAEVAATVQARAIDSLAVPALGCGGGGLDWTDVRPILTSRLAPLSDTRVLLFAPRSSAPPDDPGAEDAEPPSAAPDLTQGRALLLLLLDACGGGDEAPTIHATHNLAYLLQCAGEPLHLCFEPAPHGLQASGLDAVLDRMDGHFLDRTSTDDEERLRPRPAAVTRAEATVSSAPDAATRLRRTRQVIGEAPSDEALERLATVLWIVRHDPEARRAPTPVVRTVHDWSRRTATRFSAEQIAAAWTRLREHGWLRSDSAESETSPSSPS
ncbi:MAG: macro domain-containing protein [Salinibacter sp.]